MEIRLLRITLVIGLLASSNSFAYPAILKIYNPRNNSLFLTSQSQASRIEIPSKGDLEIVLFENSDWRAQYATGMLGLSGGLNMDEPLSLSVDICRRMVHKFGRTAKICVIQLTEFENGLVWSSYYLKVTSAVETGVSRHLLYVVLRNYFPLSNSLVTQHDSGERQVAFNHRDFNEKVWKLSENIRSQNHNSIILKKWHWAFGNWK